MVLSRQFGPAALVLMLAVGASQAGASADRDRPARPVPPHSAQLEIPLAQAIGPGQARHAQPRPGQRRGGEGGIASDPPGSAPERLFPATRVVTVYGAPQLSATIVGKKSPSGAAKEAKRLARRYAKIGPRPSQPGIDLIATVATADRGPSGLYRTRQDPKLIDSYLRAVRKVDGRLVLDIQPGRSTFLREMRAWKKWLAEPDVDVGLDPEWNVGRKGIPGITEGKTNFRELNEASAYLARLVRKKGLPQKGLFVHQFREGSIRARKRVSQRGRRVAVTLNFDGIGTPSAKVAAYRNLSQSGLYNGFSLFVSRDTDLMGFRRVSALKPFADYVMYQ